MYVYLYMCPKSLLCLGRGIGFAALLPQGAAPHVAPQARATAEFGAQGDVPGPSQCRESKLKVSYHSHETLVYGICTYIYLYIHKISTYIYIYVYTLVLTSTKLGHTWNLKGGRLKGAAVPFQVL